MTTIDELEARLSALEQHVMGPKVELVAVALNPEGEVVEGPHAELIAGELPPLGFDLQEYLRAMVSGPPLVHDPGRARSTTCYRLHLGEGLSVVYSEGVTGALTPELEALYCAEGYLEREATPEERSRILAYQRAGAACAGETELGPWSSCLERELQSTEVAA